MFQFIWALNTECPKEKNVRSIKIFILSVIKPKCVPNNAMIIIMIGIVYCLLLRVFDIHKLAILHKVKKKQFHSLSSLALISNGSHLFRTMMIPSKNNNNNKKKLECERIIKYGLLRSLWVWTFLGIAYSRMFFYSIH